MATPEPLIGVAAAATRRRLYATAMVCTAIALLIPGTALLNHVGFPLDDSWIHQSVARNLALYGSLGYLPHQRSSGSTSLLWTFVLAFKYVALGRLSPVVYALLINGACLLGITLLSLRLALRDRMSAGLALLWAVASLADGNFVWLAFSGMEHLLFVLLSLLSVDLWAAEDVPAAWAGAAMGLLAMTRPEGIVLALVLLAFPSLAGRTRRDSIFAFMPWMALAIIPFGINLLTSHALLPLTFRGRQWLYLGAQQPSLAGHMRLMLAWFQRAVYAVRVSPSGASGPLTRIGYSLGSSLLLSLSAAGVVSLWQDRCRLTLIVCGWGLLHSFLYIAMLPTPGHGGRYQPFLLMLMVPLCLRGLGWMMGLVRIGMRFRIPALALSLLVFGAISLRLWRATLKSGVAHIEGSHGVMAAFLNQNLPAEALAVFDIGRIGYTYRGRVVDLGGLTDPTYADYMFSRHVPEYLRAHGIQYVVLPTETDRSSRLGKSLNITDNPNVQLQPLFRACSPKDVWLLAFLQTNNAFQCQELDRIGFAPPAKITSPGR